MASPAISASLLNSTSSARAQLATATTAPASLPSFLFDITGSVIWHLTWSLLMVSCTAIAGLISYCTIESIPLIAYRGQQWTPEDRKRVPPRSGGAHEAQNFVTFLSTMAFAFVLVVVLDSGEQSAFAALLGCIWGLFVLCTVCVCVAALVKADCGR